MTSVAPDRTKVDNGHHGTVRGYGYYLCRCDDCRAAWATYRRTRKRTGIDPRPAKISTRAQRSDLGLSRSEAAEQRASVRYAAARKREGGRLYRWGRPSKSNYEMSCDPTVLARVRGARSAWADPTADTAISLVEVRADDLPTFLSAAKQCPLVPDRLVERALAGELLIVVDEAGPKVMLTKGWREILPWTGQAQLPATTVIGNAAPMRHHGNRGHKGHAKASWKGHISRSARARKTKEQA